MLTPERLQEIKGRCQRATPGPWRWAEWEEGAFGRPGRWVEPNPEAPVGRLALLDRENRRVIEWDELDGIAVNEANREFIAHARDDVPALVDEVERLWAVLGELCNKPKLWRMKAHDLRRDVHNAHTVSDRRWLYGMSDGLEDAADDLADTLRKLGVENDDRRH